MEISYRRLRRVTGLFVVAGLLLQPHLAVAQTTGRIVGTVTDGQGAVLPGVAVTVTSPNLQGINTVVTNETGQFRFPALPPGVYQVKAELAGFRVAETPNVRIGMDQTIALTMAMQVQGVAETVNVTGVSPVIDTSSSSGAMARRSSPLKWIEPSVTS